MTTDAIRLDPARTVVLIMDYQKGIVGSVAQDPQGVVERASHVLSSARDAGIPVIYIVHRGGRFEEPSEDAEIHPGADDPLGYRTEEEEAHYKERDCLKQLTAHIIQGGYAKEEQLQKLDEDAQERVAKAVSFADDSPFPEASELSADVYVSYW